MAVLGIVAISLMSFLALKISKNGFERIKYVFEDFQKVENIQQKCIIPLFNLREITLSLSTTNSNDYKTILSYSLANLVKKLDISLNDLHSNIIGSIWRNYKELIFTKDKNSRIGFSRGTFLNVGSTEREVFYQLIYKLKKIQEELLAQSNNTFKNSKYHFNKEKKIILYGTAVVIVLTLIFGFMIARDIIFSLDKVQNGLEKFFLLLSRKINKDEKVKIDLNSHDEFGKMAKMINENVEIIRANLKKDISLIEDATSVIDELKKGHLERRLKEEASTDELNKLKKVVNEMLDNLEDRIVQEIQERTKQEQLLIQQSKLAAMGNMVGNIAHQWRQPLGEISAILMNMQVRKEYEDLDDKLFEESIEECNKILSHMSNTISDFQNFFKPSKKKIRFSLSKECENASYIIESSLKYNNIKFIIDTKEDSQIYGYPREFSQAILNILSNAKDALLERQIKNPYIKMILKKGKHFAIVKIEDNAGGIDEKIIDRIFEPYFTTKHAKQGTGIGLYMSKIIIEENMHGFIDVKKKNNGTVFVIKLSFK